MSKPFPPQPLPAQFANSTPLECFHGYAVVGSKESIELYFGLQAKDGNKHYFVCDLTVLVALAMEFALQAEQVKAIMTDVGLKHPLQTWPTAFASVAASDSA